MKHFLIKHIGNMGDMIFFIPPVLATLKKHHPDCHITFVTTWGFKETGWGLRNQGGYSIHLMMTNPHIDQLVHWHDTKLSLTGDICQEDGKSFPTWHREYFEQQKISDKYDHVFELDFGLKTNDNPVEKMYEAINLPGETYSDYKIYLTEKDLTVARQVMQDAPRPRIVLLEGIAGTSTRGWDSGKIPPLTQAIKEAFDVDPIWFGANYTPYYQGRPLSLRESIATLTLCDVGIGVMSGPLHFAAAVGLPTLTLFCDQPLHRAAPAYFLNPYIKELKKQHHTLLGPTGANMKFLKSDKADANLTPAEAARQQHHSWTKPGRQTTKSCLAAITADEIMLVLREMLSP